jgi:hypothetical protein
MRRERSIAGRKRELLPGARTVLLTVLDADPEAWHQYLDNRTINPEVAQRRINQLRSSKAGFLAGRKAEL